MVAVCVPDFEMREGSDFHLGAAVECDFDLWGANQLFNNHDTAVGFGQGARVPEGDVAGGKLFRHGVAWCLDTLPCMRSAYGAPRDGRRQVY